MSQSQRVKASDVAREARVSTATVSYVLNQTPGQSISQETVTRVRGAADRLGYVSNPAARTLARGKSGFVVIDMSVFVTQESAEITASPIITMLRTFGYEVFMAWWPGGPEGVSANDRLISFARVTTPEAVISVLPLPDEAQGTLRSLGVSSISSLVSAFDDLIPALVAPVTTQVEYLAAQGHTHILYASSNQPELAPFTQARGAHGAQVAQESNAAWTALPQHSGVPELARSIAAALGEHPDATAIAAYNDDAALSTLFALHELGVEVPTQVAVLGIDNEKLTELTYPKLSSVAFEYDLSAIEPDVINSTIASAGKAGLIEDFTALVHPRVQVRESA